MDLDLKSIYEDASALLAQGRLGEVEGWCERNTTDGACNPIVLILYALTYAKNGNLKNAQQALEEVCSSEEARQLPGFVAKCIREVLDPDLARVFLATLSKSLPRVAAFAEGPVDPALKAILDSGVEGWPYMSETEVMAMRAALKIPAGTVDVLEWGGGSSTFFFSRTLPPGSVWNSVEHDRAWFGRLEKVPRPRVGADINFHLVPNSCPFPDQEDGDMQAFREYVQFPRTLAPSFRFILVDGRARVECLKEGWKLLARDGIMVLHDAERAEYREGFPPDGYRVELDNPGSREKKVIIFFAKTADVFRALSQSMRQTMPPFVQIAYGIPGSG